MFYFIYIYIYIYIYKFKLHYSYVFHMTNSLNGDWVGFVLIYNICFGKNTKTTTNPITK